MIYVNMNPTTGHEEKIYLRSRWVGSLTHLSFGQTILIKTPNPSGNRSCSLVTSGC